MAGKGKCPTSPLLPSYATTADWCIYALLTRYFHSSNSPHFGEKVPDTMNVPIVEYEVALQFERQVRVRQEECCLFSPFWRRCLLLLADLSCRPLLLLPLLL